MGKKYKITFKEVCDAAKKMPYFINLEKTPENGFLMDFEFNSYLSENYLLSLGIRKDILDMLKQSMFDSLFGNSDKWNNCILTPSVPVYYNPTIVNGNGLAISCANKIQFGKRHCYVIFVDNIFMKMPKELQGAMLLHEVGHILYGHCDLEGETYKHTLKRAALGLFGKVQDEEILADKFSATVGCSDDMINALLWIKKYYKSSPEINIRIKLLSNIN